MKKTVQKKLKLNAETVARLDMDTLAVKGLVVGGDCTLPCNLKPPASHCTTC